MAARNPASRRTRQAHHDSDYSRQGKASDIRKAAKNRIGYGMPQTADKDVFYRSTFPAHQAISSPYSSPSIVGPGVDSKRPRPSPRVVKPVPTIATIEGRKELSAPALRTFLRIAEVWNLSKEQQMTLLGISAISTLLRWRTNIDSTVLPSRCIKRIIYIAEIYKSTHLILRNGSDANDWVHSPNSGELFSGKSALDYMLQGNLASILAVWRYFDVIRFSLWL